MLSNRIVDANITAFKPTNNMLVPALLGKKFRLENNKIVNAVTSIISIMVKNDKIGGSRRVESLSRNSTNAGITKNGTKKSENAR